MRDRGATQPPAHFHRNPPDSAARQLKAGLPARQNVHKMAHCTERGSPHLLSNEFPFRDLIPGKGKTPRALVYLLGLPFRDLPRERLCAVTVRK